MSYFDVSINHIRAYSNIVKKYLNTYLKVSYIDWLKHVNFEENRVFTDDMFDIDPKVLILQEKKYESMSILTLSVLVFESIMKSNAFTPSVFPFIWNYNTTSKYSASVCSIYEFKPVGGIKEQLIIFTEQNMNNVSSKIFSCINWFQCLFE